MESAILVLMLLGSTILVGSFFAQITRVYRFKLASGINLFSWVQNFIGRNLFVIYGIWAPGTTGLIIIISQGLCGLFSIPLIYYCIRNRKTNGEYVKQDFNKFLFASRMITAALSIGLVIFALLCRTEINVISVDRLSKHDVFIISIFCSVIASTSFIPQAIKIMRSKNTKSLSLVLTILFITGNLLIICAFITTGIAHHAMYEYIFPTILTSIAASAMTINFSIKIRNKIKFGEK